MSSDETAPAVVCRFSISTDGHGCNLEVHKPGVIDYQVIGRSEVPGLPQHDHLAQRLSTGNGDGRGDHAVTTREQSSAVEPNGIIQSKCIEYEHGIISELRVELGTKIASWIPYCVDAETWS